MIRLMSEFRFRISDEPSVWAFVIISFLERVPGNLLFPIGIVGWRRQNGKCLSSTNKEMLFRNVVVSSAPSVRRKQFIFLRRRLRVMNHSAYIVSRLNACSDCAPDYNLLRGYIILIALHRTHWLAAVAVHVIVCRWRSLMITMETTRSA
jgi:hypothetical protein